MRSKTSFTSWASSLLLLLAAATEVQGREVPAHIKALKASIVAKGDCKNKLATGFKSRDQDPSSSSYCGDLLAQAGVVYLQSPGGKLVNMDIDCDGVQKGIGDDGRCGESDDTQAITSFVDTIKSYKIAGVEDLNPFVHSYAVFGNEGRDNWPEFNPAKFASPLAPGGKTVEPLSVMVVVCGDKMFYGVWGDENGPDGPNPVVGEAGIGLATACFGKTITGGSGHDENDVLYLAFTGKDAVPGAKGAKWAAQTFEEFEQSLGDIGDALVQRLANGNGTSPTSAPTGTVMPTGQPTDSSSSSSSSKKTKTRTKTRTRKNDAPCTATDAEAGMTTSTAAPRPDVKPF